MIRYTACVLIAFLLGTLTSAAQSKSSYTGTINVNPVRVLQAVSRRPVRRFPIVH